MALPHVTVHMACGHDRCAHKVMFAPPSPCSRIDSHWINNSHILCCFLGSALRTDTSMSPKVQKKVFCLLQWLGLPSVLIPKSNFFLQTLVSVFHVQVWFSLFLCRFLVHKTNSWYNFSSGLNCFVSLLFSGPWDWIGFYAFICFPNICHRLLLCVELWIVIHSLIDRWLVERSSTTVPLGEKKTLAKNMLIFFLSKMIYTTLTEQRTNTGVLF